MTPQISSSDCNSPEAALLRLTMRPGCLCGPSNVPVTAWTAARYDVENLPSGQRANVYHVVAAGGWSIRRFVNGVEFRQYKVYPQPEAALCDLQQQIDEEACDFGHSSRRELQRRMMRYRFRP